MSRWVAGGGTPGHLLMGGGVFRKKYTFMSVKYFDDQHILTIFWLNSYCNYSWTDKVGWLWAKHSISSGPSANRNSQAVPSGQREVMPCATSGNQTWIAESRGKELTLLIRT